MKNPNRSLLLIGFLGTLLFYGTGAHGKDPLFAASGDREKALFQEIPSVYTASKFEQKVTEAPASVSIVTADEIKKYGYRTLADLIRSVPGFYAAYDRNYHYIGVRGYQQPGDYSSRVLLLVDGHRMNDELYGQGAIGTDFILDLDLIDRVEVIRGPGSTMYGSNALLGVINVITRRGRDLKGPEVSGEAGSYETYKGRGTYGNRFQNGLELLFSGTYYDSNGQKSLYYREYDDPATNGGVTEGNDYDRNGSFYSSLSYGDLVLRGAYISRDKGIPTGSYDTLFNDPRNETKDKRWFLDLSYEHLFPKDIGVKARLFYDEYEYHGDYAYSSALLKDTGIANWWGSEAQISKRLGERHNLMLGGEYRNQFKLRQETYDEDPYFLYLDDNRRSNIWAVFAQDEIRLFQSLILNVGLRYDHYDSFGGSTNPRLALIYNPLEGTTLKALYSRAFRAPNAYELYYLDGGLSTKANPDLKAETIDMYELIWEQSLFKNFRSVFTAFYFQIDDLITQTSDPTDGLLVFRNIGTVRGTGVGLEVEGSWENGIKGRVSYNFQNVEDKDTGDRIPNSPKHIAKANVILPVWGKKVFAGPEFQYLSKRKTVNGADEGEAYLVNFTLFSRGLIPKLEGLEFSISVYNLLDYRYGDPGSYEHRQTSIEQDGRTFRVKLTYAF